MLIIICYDTYMQRSECSIIFFSSIHKDDIKEVMQQTEPALHHDAWELSLQVKGEDVKQACE